MASWLGPTVLADSIPVASGRITWTASDEVQSQLTFTVPRFTVEHDRTVDWKPVNARSPLAKFGQVVDVSILTEGFAVRQGRFLITDWEENGGHIEVTAAGTLQWAADDRLPEPMSPRDDGTLKSEFVRLLPPQLQAQFHTSLVDRPCPKSMTWDEDRLKALYEIADAWPALLRVDSWGQVKLVPPLPDLPTPVLTLTDGERGRGEYAGTIVSAPTADARAGAYNRVVARSSADGVHAFAVAEITDGPMSVNGPYGAVTMFFASPLLENTAQCRAAAQSRLAAVSRVSRVVQVTMAPDPRIELDDPLELYVDRDTPSESRMHGVVVGVDMPLTVADGEMRVDVGIF